ncbi:GlxA family transcriptional regulator, partial [Enterobacter quasiroggenkampii]|nr:GlxA family transcriptional regulator [Enterobacter quasiroggenkampii]
TDWLTGERVRRSQRGLEAGNMPSERRYEGGAFICDGTGRQKLKARFGVSPTEWRKTLRLHD